ncbi:DNA repair protein Rad60 [Danaus plexippus]|uniref:DNA repair protein Rad60 n=1 Tax=Danaus plexippus TaxID=13037 RepID=UPI002AB2191A|nr:DNA repair protein Rad60 [Danaus plexippus]
MSPKPKSDGKKTKKLQNMRDQFFKEFYAKGEVLVDTPEDDIKIVETTKSTCETVDLDDSFSIDDLLAKYTTKEAVKTNKRTKNAVKRKKNFRESDCDDLEYVIPPIKTRRASKKLLKCNETNDSIIIITDDLPQIITDTNNTTKPKRKRKTNAKDSIKPVTDEVQQITSGRNGGRNRRKKVSQPDQPAIVPGTTTRSSPRFRTRMTATLRAAPTEEYPTITIGNLAEYPDNSRNVPLFTEKMNEVIDLDDYSDENEELSVKVYWKNHEVHRFNIRRFQKLKNIFEHFSDKENVGQNQLLFTYDDAIIKPDDTPESIGYNIAKFIDGGVVNRTINLNRDKPTSKEKGIKIKFQFKNIKKPYEIYVEPDEKLSVAFIKCAEHLEIPLHKVKFQFDGDYITGKQTSRELEFEGGECIDVKIDEK